MREKVNNIGLEDARINFAAPAALVATAKMQPKCWPHVVWIEFQPPLSDRKCAYTIGSVGTRHDGMTVPPPSSIQRLVKMPTCLVEHGLLATLGDKLRAPHVVPEAAGRGS